MLLLYFVLVHLILLIPGYVFVKKSKIFYDNPGLELCAAYLLSIVVLAALAVSGYVFNAPLGVLQLTAWVFIGAGVILFLKEKIYKSLAAFRFPLVALLLASVFSCAFISLQFAASQTRIPDPEYQASGNYDVFSVKVLNVSQTDANDNYIPYRQAQFMINRSDPAKDSFIGEWGVHFFQRTPLMGAVTAQFFTIFGDTPPVAYTWSGDVFGEDPDSTYLKFQIIAHIMNALFVLPAYFLLARLFNRKTAMISLLFIIPNHFFLYNAFFSWPKSLVAFFILFSWMLLYEKRLRYVVLAGAASGVAYLAHDLAVLYIAASALLLLYWRRFRDVIVLAVTSALFALPWLITAAWVYKKPSTFMYYPFSLQGIPQPNKTDEIFEQFFSASPFKIIWLKIQFMIYQLTPYQLIFSEGHDVGRRLWSLSLFNLPGAIGLGLMVPALMGAIKKIQSLPFWIMAFTPVVLFVLVIGWKGPGALHFAQASVVLFMGLGVAFLLKLKRILWAMLAYAANCVQLIFFGLYSYGFAAGAWLTTPGDLILLTTQLAILSLCGIGIYIVGANQLAVAGHRVNNKLRLLLTDQNR